ncbi:P-loop containing nucleoside triphosphate hydrolase protein, partial [Trametopsis cervina]
MSSDLEYEDFSRFPPSPIHAVQHPPRTDTPPPPPVVPPTSPRPKKSRKTGRTTAEDRGLLEKLQPAAPNTKVHVTSYLNLAKARKDAEEDADRSYSSKEARDRMQLETANRCGGKVARWYQTDAGEAFLLGMDVVLISGTGSGKTLAFLQSLLADATETSKIIIISPLNLLEYDMVDRCNAMGLPALAVNGDTWDQELHSMLLYHEVFCKLVRNAEWTTPFLGTVIDEAHCILEWKDDFRKAFSEIDKTRSYLAGKPIFAASATLTPAML